jgi:hypothetical protein
MEAERELLKKFIGNGPVDTADGSRSAESNEGRREKKYVPFY